MLSAMVTQTSDPVIREWSDDLEGELVEAGMEQAQAKAYARAFELGMMRVMSVMATKDELLLTKEELQKSIDDLRSEMKDAIAGLRGETKDAIAGLRGETKDAIEGLREQLQREMGIRFGELKDRLDRMEHRFYWFIGITWAGLITLIVRAFS